MKLKDIEMTDEQFKIWLNSEEGGFWLANELKKKQQELDELKKISRERLNIRR